MAANYCTFSVCFSLFTTSLRKTNYVAMPLDFKIRLNLFDHLEQTMRELKRETVDWKQFMLASQGAVT